MSRFSNNDNQEVDPDAKQELAEEGKVFTEQNVFRYTDSAERWRQEFAKNAAIENKLADLSQFTYNPIDYTTLLTMVPWPERPLSSLEYLIEEAVIAAQNKYFLPLILLGSGFLVFSIGAMLSMNLILTIVSSTGALALLVWLYFTAQDRQRAVAKALTQTREIIEGKLEKERSLQDAARAKHEAAEIERVEKTERLLAGDTDAILAKLDEVISQMKLPFFLKVDVDIYKQIPIVKIWLPPKSVIPNQTCELLSTGRLEYEEKEVRTINKQYVELCAALSVQVMSVVYAHVSVVDIAYVWAMSKYGISGDECLLVAKMDRQALIGACERPSGVVALQSLQAQFECDTLLNFLSLEPQLPTEWGKVSKYEIHSMNIRVDNSSILR